MTIRRGMLAGFLACAYAASLYGQDVPAAPTATPVPSSALAPRPADQPSPTETIPLTVAKDTTLQVALDKEVRVQKVGQPIHGRIVEPVYAFDKLVIPVGTEVTGKIIRIESVSGGRRTAAALDADFTPPRATETEWSELLLPDGKRIPIHTAVAPGFAQVIQFVEAPGDENQKKGLKDDAARKTQKAKQEAKREWDAAMKQADEPGKLHRMERYAMAQLPVQPQYIESGSVYFADLREPLDFGVEPLTPAVAASINATLSEGTLVHARLITPLNSATTQKGDSVEAMVSRPVFDKDHLILPQGSLLKGSVVQVEAARRMSRNGQLRVVFHELSLPSGVQQRVDATLAAIQASKDDNLRLDSEGGARANSPKSRFLTTGLTVGLAAISFGGDSLGETGPRVAGGAGGYKLVGIVMGLTVHSQPLGWVMGAFGASKSIYSGFVARGRDVAFPKDTAMEIGIGARPEVPVTAEPADDTLGE
jgi:type IV secretory pathway VirB10-like protein